MCDITLRCVLEPQQITIDSECHNERHGGDEIMTHTG